MLHGERCSGHTLVDHRGAHADRSRRLLHLGRHIGAQGGDVQRSGFCQPNVAINTGTLIKPTLFHCGVHPDRDDVSTTVIEIIGQIITEAGIAARLPTEIESVNKDDRIAIDAVKFDADAPAEIRGRNGEGLPIPTQAGFRKFSSDLLAAMARAPLRRKGNLHRPVVRQIELAPGGIIELLGSRTVPIARFCQIRKIAGSVIEIAGRISRMTEGEAPAGVQRQFFPRRRNVSSTSQNGSNKDNGKGDGAKERNHGMVSPHQIKNISAGRAASRVHPSAQN